MDTRRFEQTISDIDQLNSADPNKEEAGEAVYPKELLYSIRMTEQLASFAPDASEELKLAARAQHISRWSIPRDDFPMTRVGYKQWRTTLAKFHAETTGRIMEQNGYDEASIYRVQSFLQKKRLKKDEEVQILEDVVCLVFLQYYFEDFSLKHDKGKLIRILQKTWAKMSARGHHAALQLPLSKQSHALIKQAL